MLADARRGTSAAIRRGDGTDDGDAEALRLAKRFELRRRAAAPLAEDEILADHDVVRTEHADQQVPREGFGALRGEALVETQCQQQIDAQAGDQPRLPAKGRTACGLPAAAATRPAAAMTARCP